MFSVLIFVIPAERNMSSTLSKNDSWNCKTDAPKHYGA